MKIGIDASRYSHPEATGVEWYSWHIINGLVEVVPKDDEIILYSKYPLKVNGAKTKMLFGKRLWTLRVLSKEMRKNPPDVLFVPSHVLPLFLPKRSVITIHDVAFRYLRKSYSIVQYNYLNWSTKFAVKRATKIIVPSAATKNDLISQFGCAEEKIEVIHHGFIPPKVTQKEIDAVFEKSEVFRYFEISKDLSYILFVGRLEKKKNLIRLVEAFAKISKKHGTFKLVLAGKRGVGFDDLIKTITRLGILEKIIIPGYVNEDEKAALYNYCDIFAFPSLYEGFGLPILEAFHYEKPVLTSHVSCLPEIAGDAACYVDPYDSELIAMGLEKLITDKKYAKNLIDLGRERVKLFDWEDAAKKTMNVLKNS